MTQDFEGFLPFHVLIFELFLFFDPSFDSTPKILFFCRSKSRPEDLYGLKEFFFGRKKKSSKKTEGFESLFRPHFSNRLFFPVSLSRSSLESKPEAFPDLII